MAKITVLSHIKNPVKRVSNCSCGKKKPYRRAVKCKECWNKVTKDERTTLLQNSGRLSGVGSLSLNGKGVIMQRA